MVPPPPPMKSMKKTIGMVLSLFASSAGAHAALTAPDEIRAGVAEVAERYANAIACGGIKIRPEDVHVLDAGRIDSHLPRYAVLWNGDLACYGGSGSPATHLIVATLNTGRYLVQPQLSSPVVAFELPVRFVTRVVRAEGNTLVLEGKEHAATDPRSNPSIPVRFTLRAEPDGNWKLVDKTSIAKAH